MLSHKLRGTDGATLHHDEVRSIVRTLAVWQALTSSAQVLELLDLVNLGAGSFSPAEWSTAPLAGLSRGVGAASSSAQTRARSGTGTRATLPAELTPLVGREAEIQHIVDMLEGEARLVTLSGAGGVGKTRLAMAVATAIAQRTETPVCAVPLATIRDPLLVPGLVAAELGLHAATGCGDIESAVLDHLHGRPLLLVLDNLEQMLGSATFIRDVLRAARKVRVLVTSRVPLRIYGEHEFRVPPLSLAPAGAVPEEILASDSAVLFIQRCRAATADFTPGPEQAELLDAICRRLDGLPLAIELAAARTRQLPLPALFDRLAHSLAVLDNGPRDAPARQRTLRATLDWSYELLQPALRRLFDHLGVFVGGCTLEAANATSSDGDEDLESALWELVDAGLLEVVQDPTSLSGAPRFRMLETVREYALARLAASGAGVEIRGRHADYYRSIATDAEPHVLGPQQFAYLTHLEQERDNFREALTWYLHNDPHLGLELAASLGWYWSYHNHYSEGRTWFTRLVACAGPRVPTAAKALVRAAFLASNQGDEVAARSLAQQGVELARDLGDASTLAEGLFHLGFVAYRQDDYPTAFATAQESLELSRKLADGRGVGLALSLLGTAARNIGDYARAALWHAESLEVLRGVGDSVWVITELCSMGYVALHDGNAEVAIAHFQEALALAQSLGAGVPLVRCLAGMAGVATLTGDWSRGAQLFGAAWAQAEAGATPLGPADRSLLDSKLAEVRNALGEADFDADWNEGRQLSAALAVAEALRGTLTRSEFAGASARHADERAS